MSLEVKIPRHRLLQIFQEEGLVRNDPQAHRCNTTSFLNHWCQINCQKGWETEVLRGDSVVVQWTFQDINDALQFKLTWA